VEITLVIPDAPGTGVTITGSGFDPNLFVWLTVEDLTDDTQPINGPTAFQPESDGTFSHGDAVTLPCGHTFQARAFVQNAVAASSSAVIPACQPAPVATGPADPQATNSANAVFADFLAAPTRSDHRLVIGQALRGWDFDHDLLEPVAQLADKKVAEKPKFLEIDLTDFGDEETGRSSYLYERLQEHTKEGGLIGFSYHVANPFTSSNSVRDRNGVEGNLSKLANPENPFTSGVAGLWQKRLNRIADVMGHFSDAVVLFRPFHESNGDWFWWGQRDPDGFRAMWKGVFRYLTGTKGLHNLLWVYSANRNAGGGPLTDPTRLYPGGDCVDLVGLDIYDDNLSDAALHKLGYSAMSNIGKPFAITEYGAWNGDESKKIPPHDGAVYLPNDKVIKIIKEDYPLTVLASAWYSQLDRTQTPPRCNNWQIGDKPNPKALMEDPWAITL
jgi:mannan endo-1,4-beta-mannosidase